MEWYVGSAACGDADMDGYAREVGVLDVTGCVDYLWFLVGGGLYLDTAVWHDFIGEVFDSEFHCGVAWGEDCVGECEVGSLLAGFLVGVEGDGVDGLGGGVGVFAVGVGCGGAEQVVTGGIDCHAVAIVDGVGDIIDGRVYVGAAVEADGAVDGFEWECREDVLLRWAFGDEVGAVDGVGVVLRVEVDLERGELEGETRGIFRELEVAHRGGDELVGVVEEEGVLRVGGVESLACLEVGDAVEAERASVGYGGFVLALTAWAETWSEGKSRERDGCWKDNFFHYIWYCCYCHDSNAGVRGLLPWGCANNINKC